MVSSLDWRPLQLSDGRVPNERDRVTAWAGDGSAFAITGDDGATWIIDAAAFTLVRRLNDTVLALAAGRAFAHSTETGAISTIDLGTGRAHVLRGQVWSHMSAGASAARLAVVEPGRSRGAVRIWQLSAPDAEPIRHTGCAAGIDTQLAFTGDDAMVRIIGTPGLLEPQTTLLWDSATNTALDVGARVGFAQPTRWTLAPDASVLAYAGAHNGRPTIAIVDASSVDVRTQIDLATSADRYVRQMCFSPDRGLLCALYGPANGPGAIAVFDPTSGRPLARHVQPDTEWLEGSRVDFTTANQLVWSQRRGGWQIADVPAHPQLSPV